MKNYFKLFLLILLTGCMFFFSACKNDASILSSVSFLDNYVNGYVLYKYIKNGETFNVPVKNASVTISTSTQSMRVSTDDTGFFKIDKDEFKDIKYNIIIETGYFPAINKEIYPLEEELETQYFYLEKDNEEFSQASYIGTILINESYAPNIKILFNNDSVLSDSKGLFKFKNLNTGVYNLHTEQNLGFNDINRKINITSHYIWVNNELNLLKPQLNVNGRVFDNIDNAPLSQVNVQVYLKSSYYYYNETIQTDSNGEFILNNLYSGDYVFTFYKTDYKSKSIEINISDEVQRDSLQSVLLDRETSIVTFTVLDSSTDIPVEGVSLKIDENDQIYTSDNKGKISITEISREPHLFKFFSYLYDTVETQITIDQVDEKHTVNMVYSKSEALLRGKIYLLDGDIPTELAISSDERELREFKLYYDYEEGLRLTEFTAVKGSASNEFIFYDLPSGIFKLDARYIVSINQESENVSAGSYNIDPEPIPVELNTGQEMSVTIVLRREEDSL